VTICVFVRTLTFFAFAVKELFFFHSKTFWLTLSHFSLSLSLSCTAHRGFETVTIAFQGEVEHRDNKGNTGVIGPGDVQWMTAGRFVNFVCNCF
jgi:Pirin